MRSILDHLRLKIGFKMYDASRREMQSPGYPMLKDERYQKEIEDLKAQAQLVNFLAKLFEWPIQSSPPQEGTIHGDDK